ncbi:hypothetical protein [Vibrio natriegens]|uniref:hypothetical protein n=1 Tax=Vibrio natriegens TaxID=691 RepID=UPI00390986D6
MIKNFTLITQAVKNGFDGVINRERYFLSYNHPNHSNTEEIIEIIGSRQTSINIATNGERYKLKQKIRRERRGRPISSYAVEFCLTLPKGYRPTKDQWNKVLKECICALSYHLNLSDKDKKEFYSNVRAVCHRQLQEGRGTGDHVHLLVGKVVNGTVITELQKKSTTKTIKVAFNQAVAKHLSLNVADYKPKELNRGRRLEKWSYTLNEKKKIEERLQKQIDKWNKAKEEGNTKQMKRQMNRINKTLAELKGDEGSRYGFNKVL